MCFGPNLQSNSAAFEKVLNHWLIPHLQSVSSANHHQMQCEKIYKKVTLRPTKTPFSARFMSVFYRFRVLFAQEASTHPPPSNWNFKHFHTVHFRAGFRVFFEVFRTLFWGVSRSLFMLVFTARVRHQPLPSAKNFGPKIRILYNIIYIFVGLGASLPAPATASKSN